MHKGDPKLQLSTLSSDTPGQLNILRHDGHTLGMNGTQVGICSIKKRYQAPHRLIGTLTRYEQASEAYLQTATPNMPQLPLAEPAQQNSGNVDLHRDEIAHL